MSGAERALQPTVDGENPYPGLQAFTEADEAYFRGRDEEKEALLRLVRRESLTVLFGASGLGKTSLLHAGLFPELRRARFFPVRIRLDFAGTTDFVVQIKARLEEEARAHGLDAETPEAKQTLWEYFHRVPFWDEKNHLLTPVLVFDQFEELFTQGGRDARVRGLLVELGDLIENRVPASVRERLAATQEELPFSGEEERVKVILALREDYLPQLEDLRGSIPSLGRNRFRLTPMNGLQAREAVLEPGGDLVDDAVATEIVRFVAGTTDEGVGLEDLEVEPALLSLVCRDLNRQRLANHKGAISLEDLAGAREDFYDRFYADSVKGLPAAVRSFIEDDLITASGSRTGEALEDARNKLGPSQDAITKLVDRRVLRLTDRLGIPHVELINDVLTPVVQESRNRRRQRVRRRRALLAGGVALLIISATIAFLANRVARLEAQQREFRRAVESILGDGNQTVPERLGKLLGFQQLTGEAGAPESLNEGIAVLQGLLEVGRIEDTAEMGEKLRALKASGADLALFEPQLGALEKIGPTVADPDLAQYEKLARLRELEASARMPVASLDAEIQTLEAFQAGSTTIASADDFRVCLRPGPRGARPDIGAIERSCRAGTSDSFASGKMVAVFLQVSGGPGQLTLKWNDKVAKGWPKTVRRRSWSAKRFAEPGPGEVRLYAGEVLIGRRAFEITSP